MPSNSFFDFLEPDLASETGKKEISQCSDMVELSRVSCAEMKRSRKMRVCGGRIYRNLGQTGVPRLDQIPLQRKKISRRLSIQPVTCGRDMYRCGYLDFSLRPWSILGVIRGKSHENKFMYRDCRAETTE